ncbi:MAG: DUF2085 domain-containing protein [Chloroflexia bacterium]|nr:DUF2085 domain-containing protein [Chloroflexia bacterium]
MAHLPTSSSPPDSLESFSSDKPIPPLQTGNTTPPAPPKEHPLLSPSYSTTPPRGDQADQPLPARAWGLPLLLLLLALFLFPLHAGEGLGFWGAGVCHRIQQRTFVIGGAAMPLCIRCSGIYLGFLSTFVVSFLRGRRRPANLPPPGVLLLLLLFLAAVGVDGLNSYLSLFPGLPHAYEPHHTLRLLTGTLEGIALAGVFMPILHMSLWQQPSEQRSIPNLGELGWILLAVTPLDLLLLWHPRYSLYPLSLLSLAGLFLALGLVNTLLVAVASRRIGRVHRWAEVLALLLWGTLLASFEMAALAWFRHALLGSFSFVLP